MAVVYNIKRLQITVLMLGQRRCLAECGRAFVLIQNHHDNLHLLRSFFPRIRPHTYMAVGRRLITSHCALYKYIVVYRTAVVVQRDQVWYRPIGSQRQLRGERDVYSSDLRAIYSSSRI